MSPIHFTSESWTFIVCTAINRRRARKTGHLCSTSRCSVRINSIVKKKGQCIVLLYYYMIFYLFLGSASLTQKTDSWTKACDVDYSPPARRGLLSPLLVDGRIFGCRNRWALFKSHGEPDWANAIERCVSSLFVDANTSQYLLLTV